MTRRYGKHVICRGTQLNGGQRSGKHTIPQDACHRIWKTCRNTKRDVEPAIMGPLKNLKCLPVDWTEYCTLYTMCSSPSVQIPATQIATWWGSMARTTDSLGQVSGGPLKTRAPESRSEPLSGAVARVILSRKKCRVAGPRHRRGRPRLVTAPGKGRG